MLQNFQKTVRVKTPKHNVVINCFYNIISIGSVKVNKRLFEDMCKRGCPNYNKKYSCPPFSPEFKAFVKNYDALLVLLFAIELNQFNTFDYNDYHKVRISNAVMKPKIEKVMRNLESRYDSFFLGTGSCRLCKPCQLKTRKPCKYPDKRRYSLEALGVDCDFLSKKLFELPLLWYKEKMAPPYTCVICALPLTKLVDKTSVLRELENQLHHFE